jgi:hypothetical protein
VAVIVAVNEAVIDAVIVDESDGVCEAVAEEEADWDGVTEGDGDVDGVADGDPDWEGVTEGDGDWEGVTGGDAEAEADTEGDGVASCARAGEMNAWEQRKVRRRQRFPQPNPRHSSRVHASTCSPAVTATNLGSREREARGDERQQAQRGSHEKKDLGLLDARWIPRARRPGPQIRA